MSAAASGTVWKISRAKGSALLVLLAIADVADDIGRNAWCGSKSLAPKTRLSEREVRRILHKLEKAGELVIEPNVERRPAPRGANGYVPPFWLHIRCVCDPSAYASGKPDNLSETAFPVGRPATGQVVRITTDENRTSCPDNRSNRGRKSVKSRHAYKEGSVSDPLVELIQGAPPPDGSDRAGASPRSPLRNEDLPETLGPVVTKLVHTVLDVLGDHTDDGELAEDIKRRCARLEGLRDYTSELVHKCIDSARWQRKHARRGIA